MAKVKHVGVVNGREKEFLKLFDQLTYSRNSWQVWEDLMTVMACSIYNAVDRREEPWKKREAEYERAIANLGGTDIPAQIFATVTMALEENPNQDFLGKLYMNLNLGNHWKGQFFTPYHICELMAKITVDGNVDAAKEIEQKGYISVADPCIGGGAMMIAAASVFREKKINYQSQVVFVGQDVDRVVAMMAYIQLSLLGCPGYIIVGDSLIHPATGHVLLPEEDEYRELWYMPMFMTEIWEMRRRACVLSSLFRQLTSEPKRPIGEHMFFFNFDEKEVTE